jgi:hypothetical protein
MTFSADDLQLIRSIFIGDTVALGIYFIFLVMIFIRMHGKKSKLLRLIFFGFTFIWFSILFSTLSKLIYLQTESPLSFFYDDQWFWFIARITQFRISFSFLICGFYLLYLFQIEIFENKHEEIKMQAYLLAGIVFISFCLVTVFSNENKILDLVAFLLTAIYALMVYIPFILDSYQYWIKGKKKIKQFKSELVFLSIMAFLMLMFFMFLILDRIVVMTNSVPIGCSMFSNFAWGSATLGLILTYFGYILPETANSKKNKK